MSQNEQDELIRLINNQLNSQFSDGSQHTRNYETAYKANITFAENIAIPVYKFLDETYWNRILTYSEDKFKAMDERISSLEQKVSELQSKINK